MNGPPSEATCQEPIAGSFVEEDTRALISDSKWCQLSRKGVIGISVLLVIILLFVITTAVSLILLLKSTSKSQCTLFSGGSATSINSGITNAISQVTTHLSRRYVEEIVLANLNQLNLSSLAASLEHDSVNLKQLVKQLQIDAGDIEPTANSAKPTAFARQIESSFWKPAGFPLPTKLGSFLERQELDLQCLEREGGGGGGRSEGLVGKWSEPILKFQELHSTFNEWFRFCLQLESKVNSYAFQKKKPPRPTPQDALDWLTYIEKHDILKVDSRIKQVAAKMGGQERGVMSAVIGFAFEAPKTACGTQPTALKIQGNFLLLSDYAPRMEELMAKCGGGATQQVDIHAGHTVFLDADISLKQLDVSILAPNWVVAKGGSPWNILLEGVPGKNHAQSSASDGPPNSGRNGGPGSMGKPGEPGGAFFGVAVKIMFSKKLHIASRGGSGGSGQAGGNGGSGSSRNAKFPDGMRFEDKADYYKCDPAGWSWMSCTTINYGVVGEAGGNGGNGGAKGVGGVASPTSVIQFETSDKPVVLVEYTNSKGSDGREGAGGSGGPGGAAGNGFVCTGTSGGDRVNKWDKCDSSTPSHGRGPGATGKSGTPGVSTACQVSPKSPRKIEEWKSMLDYKVTFLNKSHPATVEFIRDSDTSHKTRDYFTLKALAEESLELENVVRATANPSRLRDMYFSLIRKLEEYSNAHYGSSTPEEKKVVGILLTSSFSSVMNLRGPLGVGVVVDVTAYFDLVMDEINQLKTASAVVTIGKEKKGFEGALRDKIGQTTRLLRDVVNPAVIEAGSVVEEKLDQLKQELVSLVKDSKLQLWECKDRLRRAEAETQRLAIFKPLGVINDLLKAASSFIPGAGTAVSAFDAVVSQMKGMIGENPEDVGRLEELVKEAERLVQDLEEKKKDFEKEFQPLIASLLNYFGNVSDMLSKGEEVIAPQLGVTKWQVVGKLKEAKMALDELCDRSLDEKPLIHAFDRMQDVLTLMITLYEMIDHYLEVQSLAGYITNVNSAALHPVPINDPDLRRAVANFDKKLRENMVEQEVGKAIHAFKQWVFPFAKFYFYLLTPTEMSGEVGSAQLSQVEQLHKELKKYKSMSVSGQDTFIIQTEFSAGLHSSKPFFCWSSEQFAGEIEALLSGSKVHLNADVRQAGMPGRDAIKFKLIEIHLKLNGASPSLQKEFDEMMDRFGVSMTHSGVSYYRFQNDYYSMTGENQTLKFNFERGSDGNRLGPNKIYDKFKDGDYLLSPYSLWTVQLLNVVPERNGKQVDFSSLKKFAPQVDIELVGIGTYVDAEEAVKWAGGDLQLDKYYERDDSLRLPFKF